MTGLSAESGSWKIMLISRPRRLRIRAGGAARRSSPAKETLPETILRPRGRRPISALAVTDLPEPDSPTTQTISLGSTVKLTSSIACARSPPGGRRTVRFSTRTRESAIG
jgi:hypothetical protein